MGEAELQALIGPGVAGMLANLGDTRVTARALADLLATRDPARWLLDKEWREQLFFALPEDDALSLLRHISGDEADDPWAALVRQRFPRNGRAMERLADAFGIELPDDQSGPLGGDLVTIGAARPLFPHQRSAIEKLSGFLRAPPRRVVLHMPTGSGKTRTAMNVICELLRDQRGVVVWLAHSEELCDQAAAEFEAAWEHLGNRQVQLGRLYSHREASLSDLRDGFLVAGLQKLYSRSLSDQSAVLGLKRKVHLVVIDEAHLAIAPTYNHVLTLLAPDERRDAILGLTATPGRGGGHEESEDLASFFTRKKVTLEVEGYSDPIKFLEESGYLARATYEYIRVASDFALSLKDVERLSQGFDVPPRMLRELAQDEQRNVLILERTLELASANRSVLVFACSVDHAVFLSDVLNLQGISAAAITAETDSSRRRDSIKAFQNGGLRCLTNFGVLTTGFDAPRADCAVVARPTKSIVLYSQMIGRVLRGPRAGGTDDAVIVTVVDEVEGFRSVYEAFNHWEELWE